jgi:hypothetical protein
VFFVSSLWRRPKNQRIGSGESGEWFFTCAFLFATSPSYEGGEKRTTAKNKGADW